MTTIPNLTRLPNVAVTLLDAEGKLLYTVHQLRRFCCGYVGIWSNIGFILRIWK